MFDTELRLKKVDWVRDVSYGPPLHGSTRVHLVGVVSTGRRVLRTRIYCQLNLVTLNLNKQ